MFVLYSEQRPHAAPHHLAKGNEERHKAGMLRVVCVDCVEDPVEANYGIYDHGAVIPPSVFKGQRRAEETVLCIRIHET